MIKFRAWDKATSSYRKVLEIEFYPDGELKKVKVAGLQRKGTITPDNLVLERFTGMKDMNGNEIYEGDIIKSSYKYAQPKVSQIIIENGNSYILGEDLATGNEMLVSDHISEIKVIGNVHTNPELLKG
ncbi:YopX family protein [Lactiplantibacillus paraplantarum]|uniref:YopX family protein n=1 Tax=Lactiplantibacillus paraplantarum TaxID=60520 RepID=UPI002221456D|nr:YopX family protein [Lactiplantibacillus paraplantarum]MCW1909903.1 YopX family protein [Lactiplantibacillus paraplantarum]